MNNKMAIINKFNNSTINKKERNLGFDLIRMIIIYTIAIDHIIFHGKLNFLHLFYNLLFKP